MYRSRLFSMVNIFIDFVLLEHHTKIKTTKLFYLEYVQHNYILLGISYENLHQLLHGMYNYCAYFVALIETICCMTQASECIHTLVGLKVNVRSFGW